MKIRKLHAWNLTPKEAIELQTKLRSKVIKETTFEGIETVAGADIAIDMEREEGTAAVIVFTYPDLEKIDISIARAKLTYPYIPGLLSFRECPILLEAFSELKIVPDVVLFDGQGVAHPRGLGLASHMGLWLDLPTIGCAKSRLIGEHDEPGNDFGNWAPLFYKGRKMKDEGRRTMEERAHASLSLVSRPSSFVIGAVLRTRRNVKPIYVSIGHKIDLDTSIDIVLGCCDKTRIPKPTREADRVVGKIKREPLPLMSWDGLLD